MIKTFKIDFQYIEKRIYSVEVASENIETAILKFEENPFNFLKESEEHQVTEMEVNIQSIKEKEQ